MKQYFGGEDVLLGNGALGVLVLLLAGVVVGAPDASGLVHAGIERRKPAENREHGGPNLEPGELWVHTERSL